MPLESEPLLTTRQAIHHVEDIFWTLEPEFADYVSINNKILVARSLIFRLEDYVRELSETAYDYLPPE